MSEMNPRMKLNARANQTMEIKEQEQVFETQFKRLTWSFSFNKIWNSMDQAIMNRAVVQRSYLLHYRKQLIRGVWSTWKLYMLSEVTSINFICSSNKKKALHLFRFELLCVWNPEKWIQPVDQSIFACLLSLICYLKS